ncbi:hypothetical protein [Streptomyces sp. CC208A]|uniref:hypothetical protein n=1 Tax=Streptomyces sp. CC208A TaxID=3044573 RepID=UPI0024A7F6D1|nr:hypothetical protein [Streptomyces sp. CC208A]
MPWKDVDDGEEMVLCGGYRHLGNEDLALRSATGESVPVYVPHQGNGRAGRHLRVSADDRALRRWLISGKTPLPTAAAEPKARTT